MENQCLEYKSLRLVQGKTADWRELAKDCVAFANAEGGRLLIGIEDGKEHPQEGQRIPDDLLATVLQRLRDHSHNVHLSCDKLRDDMTGGEYLEITIPRSLYLATTSDGKCYRREGAASMPVLGNDLQHLLTDRSGAPWETRSSGIAYDRIDSAQMNDLTAALRASERVSANVKEKSDAELLAHYSLIDGETLTNLGVLWLGRPIDRARLGTAPSIQCIKYDECDNKVQKFRWDDHTRSPMQLLESVWLQVPDFVESYELPEGLFRRSVPAFDQRVVRELLVNALVHRPYTQRGDIFLNLHPDRLRIVNPGSLPPGITPHNILHKMARRNNEFARLFHDLGFMEQEGSGFDLIYELLTAHGRGLPIVEANSDSVAITIPRRIVRPEVIDLLARVSEHFQLRQRSRITLGILAQHESLSARELRDKLGLTEAADLAAWLHELLRYKFVHCSGRTKGTQYFVDPDLLRRLDFPARTTLRRIEPHRLNALIREDLARHPESTSTQIHQRIGSEIHISRLRRHLSDLIKRNEIICQGQNRWRTYRLADAHPPVDAKKKLTPNKIK